MTLLVACVAAASLGAPAAAHAQDAAPPWTEFEDPAGSVSMRLPTSWHASKRNGALGNVGHGLLASWFGTLGAGGEVESAVVDVFVSRNSRRPIQVLTTIANALEPTGPVRSGADWVAQRFRGRERTLWVRCQGHASGVVVFSIAVRDLEPIHEITTLARSILDAARIVAEPPQPLPPEGSVRIKVRGFEVWTKEGTEEAAREIVKQIERYRNAVLDELDGKPVDDTPPRIWIYEQGIALTSQARLGNVVSAPNGQADYLAHAHAIGVVRAPTSGHDREKKIQWATTEHAVTQWFGGGPPAWIWLGLKSWLAWAPEPDLDPRDQEARIRNGRATYYAESGEPLDRYFYRSRADIEKHGRTGIVVGYHHFLRTARKARKWRKPYLASLAAIRETGDAGAAADAWGRTDFVALFAAFLEWAE